MGSSLSAAPHPRPLPSPLQWASIHKAGPNPSMNLFIASAASPRLASLLRLSFEKLSLLYHLPRLEDLWSNSASGVKGIGLPPFSDDLFASTFSFSLYFFDGGDSRKGPENQGISEFGPPKKKAFNGRRWTNILLAINVLAYVAQVASQGKLLLWGAKINSLIDKGQVWRLLTSSLLHANIGHLLVNCYSLNSIGPTVENLTGPRRFLAVYITSAIASSATSYWLCKAPAVGASGAIFGLVGSTAVFVIRHKGMIRGGKENLQHIAQVIFLNMVIGMLSKGIDNWGHLGGLLGGVATSWLLGPAWRYEPLSDNNRTRRFVDRAPIKYLTNGRKEPWRCS